MTRFLLFIWRCVQQSGKGPQKPNVAAVLIRCVALVIVVGMLCSTVLIGLWFLKDRIQIEIHNPSRQCILEAITKSAKPAPDPTGAHAGTPRWPNTS